MVNQSSTSRIRPHELWALVVILLVATALRLVSTGQVPPGFYHDEAYNGLDALQVLDGDLSLYFAANNGREPMFIYLVALSVGLLGRSPMAVRLAAFVPGLLTIAVTYALTRTLFSRRVGILSAAVLCVTLWHVHLSRVGFRAILLPLFMALALWQGVLGWRFKRRRYWFIAGLFYGLSFYTYIPARFTLAALLVFGAYLLLSRTEWRTRQHQIHLISLALGTMITLVPLLIFTVLHLELVLGRTGQVSIWNPEIHGGDFGGTLIRHITNTAGMFFVKGDRIWRHNVPGRPIFDPIMGSFFLIGLGHALWRLRSDPRMALIVILTGTMSLPTLLAEDAPHFLRAAGILPCVTLFPALGMDWLVRNTSGPRWFGSLRSRLRRVGSPPYQTSARREQQLSLVLQILPPIAVVVALISTSYAYFIDYARADLAGYWFEEGAATLAGQVNSFLGTGWNGERMQRGAAADHSVYIEQGLWENWTSVPFLIPQDPAVRLLLAGNSWPDLPRLPSAVFVWPYGDWQRVWSLLSHPVEIRVQDGALSQGDRDPEPYTTYRAFNVSPPQPPPPTISRFQYSINLVDVKARITDQGISIDLFWHAVGTLSDDYTVFVHYMRDEQRIAQADAQPARGSYPTSRWHVGDMIHDTHRIELPGQPEPVHDRVMIGWYRPSDGYRLSVLDPDGNPNGNSVTLPISEILH